MELLQLRYFCAAAENENFSKTAKRFGVPPSDVSQSIKRLETELGVMLFDRRNNSLLLNERGRVFAEKAREALTLLKEGCALAQTAGAAGQLRLSINSNRRVVMQAVDVYRRQYPDVDIVIRHGVVDDDFHLMIAGDGVADGALERRRILSEEIVLAVSKDSPLAKKARITAEDLAECAFITMGRDSNLYKQTETICRHYGVVPRIALVSDDPFYIRRCVDLGLGVAFVPSVSWQGQFSETVVLRSIGDWRRHTYVYWKAKEERACVRDFLDILIAECEKETNKSHPYA